MAWGLDGLQLSYDHRAMFMDDSGINIFTSIVNWIISRFSPYYDFYLSGDITNENATIHHLSGETISGQIDGGESGRTFFNEILTESDHGSTVIGNIVRELPDKTESAIEYCNNKNYRDGETGKVSTSNWYLPSIDEMQEIVVGGYTDFDVFQDNFYWSNQPAYLQQHIFYDYVIHRAGTFMIDDILRARATKVYISGYNGNGDPQWEYVPSGVTGYTHRNYIDGLSDSDFHTYEVTSTHTYRWYSTDEWAYITEIVDPLKYQDGHKPRTEKCRVRAVYRSGTGTRGSSSSSDDTTTTE